MNKFGRSVFFTALFLVIVAFVASVEAKKVTMWKWVDAKGALHFSDEQYKIPQQYRAKAVKIEVEVPESQISSQPSPPPSSSQSNQAQDEEKLKAEWKNKARNALARVKELDELIKSMNGQCLEAMNTWQVMPSIENRQIWENCAGSLAAVEVERTKAIEYRDTGIYKEAQKAGVPRDWIYYILRGMEK